MSKVTVMIGRLWSAKERAQIYQVADRLGDAIDPISFITVSADVNRSSDCIDIVCLDFKIQLNIPNVGDITRIARITRNGKYALLAPNEMGRFNTKCSDLWADIRENPDPTRDPFWMATILGELLEEFASNVGNIFSAIRHDARTTVPNYRDFLDNPASR